MTAIAEALSGLRLGAHQKHLNLSIFPLFGDVAESPDYLLLDEALEKNLAEITEVSQAGSVPNLAFENKSPSPILLVEGDELRGAKQNRILNLTIMVAPWSKIEIPVSCVEAGRWSYKSSNFQSGSGGGGGGMYAAGRAANFANVTQSLKAQGSAVGDQSKVWADIGKKLERTATLSATSSMSDVYTNRAADVKEYEAAFVAAPGQRGAVFCVNGRPVGVELFDSDEPFRKFFVKLVRSYALDALEKKADAPAPNAQEVDRFLDEVKAASPGSFETVGEGEALRWQTDGMTGAARVVGGKAVHVAGFRLG